MIFGRFIEIFSSDIIIPEETDAVVASVQSSGPTHDSAPQPLPIFDENLQSSPDLSQDENSRLHSFLQGYADIFANSNLDLEHTSVIQHEIDTGDARPIKQLPYRVSQQQRAEIDKHITNMLEQDIIRASSSPWSSPVVLVKRRVVLPHKKLAVAGDGDL